VDRFGGKTKGSVSVGTMNVAIMAGSVDEKKMMELQTQARLTQAADMAFLGKTASDVRQLERLDVPYTVKDASRDKERKHGADDPAGGVG